VPKAITVTYRVFENGDAFAEGAAAYTPTSWPISAIGSTLPKM
jgi:hypothetical protein